MTSASSTRRSYQLGPAMFEFCALAPAAAPKRSVRELPTEFVHLCEQHGLAGFVFERLGPVRAQIPAPTRAAFEAAALRTMALARRQQKLTTRVLDALGAVEVVPVLLKGAGLAQRVYPEPLLRVSSDVDVLLEASSFDRAATALESLGLRAKERPWAPERGDHHEVAFEGPAGLVELHLDLFRGFGRGGLRATDVLPRARRDTCWGRPVRFLALEDEVLYLAVHAANHSFLRASWLVDLLLLIRREGARIDWHVVEQRADAAHVRTAWHAAMAVAAAAFTPEAWPAPATERPRRWPLLETLFTPAQLASAQVAGHRLGAPASRALMNDSLRDLGLDVYNAARRWVRRGRSS